MARQPQTKGKAKALTITISKRTGGETTRDYALSKLAKLAKLCEENESEPNGSRLSLNGSKLDPKPACDWSFTGGGGAARSGVLLVDLGGAGLGGGALLFLGGSAGVGLSDRKASPPEAPSEKGENPNGSF